MIEGHEVETSRLLRARARMQQRYLAQFHDLYDGDFHLTVLPLLEEEVRGVDQIRAFSARLLGPSAQGAEAAAASQPGAAPHGTEPAAQLAALQRENAALRREVAELRART